MEQGFYILALLSGHDSLLWGGVLWAVGYLAAALAARCQWHHLPSHDNKKCSGIAKRSQGAKSPPIENPWQRISLERHRKTL